MLEFFKNMVYLIDYEESIKMTRLQKAILGLVQASDGHLSAKDIYALIQEKFPTVALGTVYRNLNQFAEKKLIRRVAGLGSADYYEGNTEPHNHSLCVSCGKMDDILVPDMEDYIKGQISGRTVSMDLVVNIICDECINKGTGHLEDDINGSN